MKLIELENMEKGFVSSLDYSSSNQVDKQQNTQKSHSLVNVVVDRPDDKDIICGKDRLSINHPGSIRFRKMIDQYQERYSAVLSKPERMAITKEMFGKLRKQGARFLKYDDSTKAYKELTRMKALDKMSHALRTACRREAKRRNRMRPKTVDTRTTAATTTVATHEYYETASSSRVTPQRPIPQQHYINTPSAVDDEEVIEPIPFQQHWYTPPPPPPPTEERINRRPTVWDPHPQSSISASASASQDVWEPISLSSLSSSSSSRTRQNDGHSVPGINSQDHYTHQTNSDVDLVKDGRLLSSLLDGNL